MFSEHMAVMRMIADEEIWMMVYFIVVSDVFFVFLVDHLEKASVLISSIVHRRIHVFEEAQSRVVLIIVVIIMGFLYMFFFSLIAS
jgi:hypothetical protein